MSAITRAIGIDIGGTKTVVAAVNASGEILARAQFQTLSTRGFSAGLADISSAIRQVLAEALLAATDLTGIGIGCAGPVDPIAGTIHNPFTLPGWEGADIVGSLRKQWNLPVRLENDADAAALGEFRFGAGRNSSPLVMATLGTGIGGAILMDGRIYRGVAGTHAELGHIAVAENGPECYCGIRGCWESIASGTAIASAGRAFGFADSHGVFAAAHNNSEASAIIERAAQATAAALWTLAHTIVPQRIILGGGIGEEHFDRFSSALRNQIERATQIPKSSIEIAKAQLGNAAGVIGAACLSFQAHEEKGSQSAAQNSALPPRPFR